MIARWRWALGQMTHRLWFRAGLFSLVGIATALIAVSSKDLVPASLPTQIGADSVDEILGIIASSMLAVTTFSLSTMVTAYGAASSGVTPRATKLVMEDNTTQNALGTFIGSFLFSLVGIIALSTGLFGAQGRVMLFGVTVVVIILIVYTLLRWIDHLSRLGQVGETIDRVEAAAQESIERRAKWPHLGGARYPNDLVLPSSAKPVVSVDTGYVQYIDVEALGALATELQIKIYMDVLPGSFVHLGSPVARVVGTRALNPDEWRVLCERVLQGLTIGVRRTFEQDPRFGLSVLAEIASRALSPATNDSGTVIDVLGRGVRCLTAWGTQKDAEKEFDADCTNVYLRGLSTDDLFDDFFTPIARDGAGLLEVDIRMVKALVGLCEINPTMFRGACSQHAVLLLKRAEKALEMDEEKAKLFAVAKRLTAHVTPQPDTNAEPAQA